MRLDACADHPSDRSEHQTRYAAREVASHKAAQNSDEKHEEGRKIEHALYEKAARNRDLIREVNYSDTLLYTAAPTTRPIPYSEAVAISVYRLAEAIAQITGYIASQTKP